MVTTAMPRKSWENTLKQVMLFSLFFNSPKMNSTYSAGSGKEYISNHSFKRYLFNSLVASSTFPFLTKTVRAIKY